MLKTMFFKNTFSVITKVFSSQYCYVLYSRHVVTIEVYWTAKQSRQVQTTYLMLLYLCTTQRGSSIGS